MRRIRQKKVAGNHLSCDEIATAISSVFKQKKREVGPDGVHSSILQLYYIINFYKCQQKKKERGKRWRGRRLWHIEGRLGPPHFRYHHLYHHLYYFHNRLLLFPPSLYLIQNFNTFNKYYLILYLALNKNISAI